MRVTFAMAPGLRICEQGCKGDVFLLCSPFCGTTRCDCSGYVSNCWKLSTGYTTFTLHEVSHQISKDDVLPVRFHLTLGVRACGPRPTCSCFIFCIVG